MVLIIISLILFVAGAVCIYLFSLIKEDMVGKWFLVNGLVCIIAGLVLLYFKLW